MQQGNHVQGTEAVQMKTDEQPRVQEGQYEKASQKRC